MILLKCIPYNITGKCSHLGEVRFQKTFPQSLKSCQCEALTIFLTEKK